MYGREKTGMRRLWDFKIVFFAAIVAIVACIGQLPAAYLSFLPSFADMKPFTFLALTVVRWALLSLPAYVFYAYLEDHYAAEGHGRFVITAGISAAAVLVQLVISGGSYLGGFISGNAYHLIHSIAMTALLALPVVAGLSMKLAWKPLYVWISAGVCGVAMITLAVFSIIIGDAQMAISALAYVALCVSYGLAVPKILAYEPAEEEPEEWDDTPAQAPIMKDEY